MVINVSLEIGTTEQIDSLSHDELSTYLKVTATGIKQTANMDYDSINRAVKANLGYIQY